MNYHLLPIRVGVFMLLVLAAAGCATQQPLLDARALPELSNIDAEQWALATAPGSSDALLALTDEMREFVDAHVTERRDKDRRVRQLTRAVLHPGSLGVDYDDAFTGSAQQVFNRASGNCLSLSMLFVAMARYADIDASFYEVDVIPNWTRSDDIIFATRHVNVGGKVSADAEFVMDFSPDIVRREIRRRKMRDREAYAQYYNNLGARFLADGDLPSAWLHFSEGLALAPQVSFLWSNLAVVYSRNAQFDQARLALESALLLDGDNTSALTNLALMKASDGDESGAAALRERIALLRQDNPYYQFALAENLLRSGDFDSALDRLHAAIRLRDDEPLFFHGAAAAARGAGDVALADRYIARAAKLDKARQARHTRALNR
ncbi:MAG: hypothetical protein AAF004_03300 [Pseudomonadota bacterium]